jgi:GLEYA domain
MSTVQGNMPFPVETPVCQLAFPTSTTSVPFVRFYDAPGQGGGTLANVPPCSSVYSSFAALNGINHPQYDRADNYSSRARGWLRPTISGLYTFYITSDDFASFALGVANGNFAATLPPQISNAAYSGPPGVGGASFTINLTAGQAYPWEVLHSEGGGGDYWRVDWSGPVGARQIVPASVIFNDNPNAKIKRTLTKRVTGTTIQYFDTTGAWVIPSSAEPIVDCAANIDYVCPPQTSATYIGPVGYYNGFAISAVRLDNFSVRYDNITNSIQVTSVSGAETISYFTTRARLAATLNNASATSVALPAGTWVSLGNNLLTDGDLREIVFTPTAAADGRAYKIEVSQWTTPVVKVVISLQRIS